MNEDWDRLRHKMQIFMMLKQNLKEMYKLDQRHRNS
jgi:hypothetical protein